jgi:hypothetical protein
MILFHRLPNDIAITQALGDESGLCRWNIVIQLMSKLSLKIRWTSTGLAG